MQRNRIKHIGRGVQSNRIKYINLEESGLIWRRVESNRIKYVNLEGGKQ